MIAKPDLSMICVNIVLLIGLLFVNIWNSLLNWVVTAESTNTRLRLDTFWPNQDVMYDLRAQLEVEVKFRIKK